MTQPVCDSKVSPLYRIDSNENQLPDVNACDSNPLQILAPQSTENLGQRSTHELIVPSSP